MACTVSVKLGVDGKVCVYVSAATHLIVDVNGAHPAGSDYLALARQVVADDEQINRLRYQIEEACFITLATQAPTAGDLRIVMMIVKTIPMPEKIAPATK